MTAVTSWPAGQAGPTEPELAPGSAVKGAEVARGQLVRDSQLCLKPPLWMSPNVFVFLGGDNAFNSRGEVNAGTEAGLLSVSPKPR